jgi:hypothetical protein
MKKRILTITALALGGVFFLTTAILTAADSPDEVIINTEGYKSDKKGPVPLSHAKHSEEYDIGCDACHHEYEDGENVWKEGDPVKKCVECHDTQKSDGDVKKLQIAFHNNCKNCHKEVGDQAPSKKCTDCHSKD